MMKHINIRGHDLLIGFIVFYYISLFSVLGWGADGITVLDGQIPLFNGARVLKQQLFQGSGSCDFEVVAAPEDVIHFYNQEMQSKGWPSGVPLVHKGKGMLMIERRGDRFAVTAEQKDNATMVRVALFLQKPSSSNKSIDSPSKKSRQSQAQGNGSSELAQAPEPFSREDSPEQPPFPVNMPVADRHLELFLGNVRSNNSLDVDKPLVVHFTQSVNPVFFSFEVTSDKGKWTPKWSADFRQVTLVPDYVPEPDQTINLTARVTGGPGVEKAIVFNRLPPERQLVHDLKAGRIDINQASRYRLFSLFKPSQVPEMYRMTHFKSSGTPLLKKVRQNFDQLDEATRQELEPYFLDPRNPRSYWYEILHQKSSLSQSFLPFNFISEAWASETQTLVEEIYTTDNGYRLIIVGMSSEAEVVRRAHDLIKKEKMYEEFKKLLNKDVPTPTRNIYFYIIPKWVDPPDKKEDKEALEDEPDTDGMFTFGKDTLEPVILISAYSCKEENTLGGTLAHELFHAFQTAFKMNSAAWLEESTAVWAENFINKEWNSEQIHLEDTFDRESARTWPLDNDSDYGVYGFYIFPYYLSNVEPKDDSLIRKIWEKRGQGMSEIGALIRVLGDDLGDIWKGYSLSTLDVEPRKKPMPDTVGKRFGGANPLVFSDKHGWENLNVTNNSGDQVMVELKGLQTAYFDVFNGTTDSDVPPVRINLEPFEKYRDKLSVQAAVHYSDGRKEYEDWTGRNERLFCLARESDNFDEIYIAIGSSDSQLNVQEPLSVTYELSSRCHSGTVTLTRQFEERELFDSTSRIAATTNVQSRQREGSRSATLRLELDLNNPILPQQRDALDQMEARVKDVDPEQVKLIRQYMETIMKTPQSRLNEETGLKAISYRIKSCSITSAGGMYRWHRNSARTDKLGRMQEQSEGSGTEQWTAAGLSAKTLENIERGHIRVHVFYEPDDGTIKWLWVPQLDIDMMINENSESELVRRRGTGYESIPRSLNDEKEAEEQVTSRRGGKDRQGLPADPVWKVTRSSGKTVFGGARYETPIDHTWDENESKGARQGMMVETFEWSLNFNDMPMNM